MTKIKDISVKTPSFTWSVLVYRAVIIPTDVSFIRAAPRQTVLYNTAQKEGAIDRSAVYGIWRYTGYFAVYHPGRLWPLAKFRLKVMCILCDRNRSMYAAVLPKVYRYVLLRLWYLESYFTEIPNRKWLDVNWGNKTC